jgi:hypothetical protein
MQRLPEFVPIFGTIPFYRVVTNDLTSSITITVNLACNKSRFVLKEKDSTKFATILRKLIKPSFYFLISTYACLMFAFLSSVHSHNGGRELPHNIFVSKRTIYLDTDTDTITGSWRRYLCKLRYLDMEVAIGRFVPNQNLEIYPTNRLSFYHMTTTKTKAEYREIVY